MIHLTNKDWDDLHLYELGKINSSELQTRIPHAVNYEEFRDILLSYLFNPEDKRYNSKFHTLFWFLPKQISQTEESAIYNEFLLKHGHNEHEEIVGLYQIKLNNNPLNTETLLKAIKNVPNYFSQNESKYSYIRKIIYDIGAQPEPYNVITLKMLAEENDVKIKELALHQIKKRQNLGRWEVNRHL